MKRFLDITKDFFQLDQVYSFRVFIYDKRSQERTNGLIEKSPLTQERLDEWILLEEKGVRLQIHHSDLEALCHECEIEQTEIEKYNEVYYNCLKMFERRLVEYKELSEKPFNIKACLHDITKSKNFLPLIERVRAEVLCFPLNLSQEVSLCTLLVEKLFTKDIHPVRVAALAYVIAVANKITEPQELAAIVLAALTRDLGHTMLQRSKLMNKEELKDDDFYLKHPMLSIYVLSKTGLDFNNIVKRYILEHHELSDGAGFPRGKKEPNTAQSSYMIHMAEQIIQGSQGEGAMNLTSCLWALRNQNEESGIEVKFPKNLADSMLKLIELDKSA